MRTPRFATVIAFLVLAGLSGCGGGESIVANKPVTPVPANVSVVDGDGQSGMFNRQLATPLTVEVVASNGLGMANVKVDWNVNANGGMLSTGLGSATGISVTTDKQGLASVDWILGTTAGTQSVSASVSGIKSLAVFSATAVAPPILLHYDGATWSISLRDNHGAISAVRSVWGSSASDIFLGGGGCDGGFIVHYDGTSWGDTPGCSGGSLSFLTAIWGSSPSDVFALSHDGLPPSTWTDISHYDGQSWTTTYRYAPGPTQWLQSVWSRSPNDAFAVGDNGVIMHFDGNAWNAQSSGTTQNLRAVWGLGSGPVFAAGDGGTILYYDGTTWRAQASGTTQVLAAISGTSASDVFAVGGGGTILHYDGTTWTAQTSGTGLGLSGVWAGPNNVAFAVGDASTILRYDGTAWTLQPTTASMTFRGVWGTSPTNVYVAGEQR